MPVTLPTFSRSMDDKFMTTWYDIKAEAADNILLATNIWAALKSYGCFKTQVGGDRISRAIRYAVGTPAKAVRRGITLPSGETETRTNAFWTFRNVAAAMQRSTFEDRENQGQYRITSYVSKRVEEARDAMAQKFETDVLRAHVTDETGDEIQGLNDLVPPIATAVTGTYGGITRPSAFAADALGVSSPSTGNTFWGGRYKQLTAPYEVTLVPMMKTLFNSIEAHYSAPDLLVSDQQLFEMYEGVALDASQVIKDVAGKLVDLGFTVLRFKGKPMIWSPNITATNMLFLNTKWIEVVYDPTLWFDMTEWKVTAADSTERIAHIISSLNMLSDQPRRHGRLYT